MNTSQNAVAVMGWEYYIGLVSTYLNNFIYSKLINLLGQVVQGIHDVKVGVFKFEVQRAMLPGVSLIAYPGDGSGCQTFCAILSRGPKILNGRSPGFARFFGHQRGLIMGHYIESAYTGEDVLH